MAKTTKAIELVTESIEFTQLVARLTLDGECATCGKFGDEKNRKCARHRAFDMSTADACDTLSSIIQQAREILQ